MMQFKVDKNSLNELTSELTGKLDGIKSLTSSYAREQVAKASFTILSKEFIRRTSVLAKVNPQVYHHVYEWGGIGDADKKLFVLKRAGVTGGNLRISSHFLDSKKPVPIDPILRRPGKNGRIVTKSSVFKKKAEMMESGKPTKPFSAKTAKALAFVQNGRIAFIKRPNTRVIQYPGGKQTVGSFNRQFMRWFNNSSTLNNAIEKSGMMNKIEKAVAKSLDKKGAGSTSAINAMKKVTDAYSMGVKAL